MKLGSAHPPAFEAFLRGREPVFLWRFEKQTRNEDARRARHRSVHPYAVIFLLMEGRSRMNHSGLLETRPGDVHLIPPGDAHSGLGFDDATGWALGFWPEQTPLSLRLFSQVRGGCHPVLHTTPAQRRKMAGLIQALQHEVDARAEGRETAIAALMQLILLELNRASTTHLRAASGPSGLARAALDFIERSALQPLSLSVVAKAVARTPAHVANVVRDETGRTVGEWIRAQRMAEARRRLRASNAAIERIAEQVGYADVTHFIRQFRREHGQTPARWRRDSMA